MLKRGISDVVTAVLLILLVFIAVVIVWTFVKPLIEKSGEETNSDCILAQVEPQSCVLYDIGASGPTKANVTVSRGPGGVSIKGLKLIFDGGAKVVDINDTIVIFNNDQIPVILESKKYIIDISGFDFTPKKFNVAAAVGANRKVCNVIALEVNCF